MLSAVACPATALKRLLDGATADVALCGLHGEMPPLRLRSPLAEALSMARGMWGAI